MKVWIITYHDNQGLHGACDAYSSIKLAEEAQKYLEEHYPGFEYPISERELDPVTNEE